MRLLKNFPIMAKLQSLKIGHFLHELVLGCRNQRNKNLWGFTEAKGFPVGVVTPISKARSRRAIEKCLAALAIPVGNILSQLDTEPRSIRDSDVAILDQRCSPALYQVVKEWY